MIHVEEISKTSFKVTVDDATTTVHWVTLTPEDYLDLTDGRVSHKQLVAMSFEFLLEREPNTSILRQFELPAIARYFPEYPEEIQERIGD